ncbi:MAG: PAS domain S-box protein, partial [Chthoniobacterales bacterium]|nr:PAS domain S-box protein [Chthoniobacterales bacterium]
ITAKHKIEVAKEKTRVFLQRLVNAIPGVLCIRDSEGKFLLINEYAGLVFGLRPEEVIGKRDEDLGMPIEEAEAIRKADRMVIQTKQNMFLERDRIWTQEGWIGWFQTTKIPFEHPDSLDGAVLSLSVDVTARMEAEKRLENLNAELRQAYRQAQLALADEKKQSQFVTDLTNSIPIAIYYKDRDGNFLDCNPAASVLTGYSREELINLTIAQRDGEEVARIARQEDLDLLSGRVPILRKERWIGHKSGRKIPTIMTKAPIHDEKGNVIGIVAALMDISELKEMEEELRNATQRAQAANEAKTAFLATMSHELRTPLTSVVGTASVLAESDLPSELRGYVATICRSSQTLLE